MIRNTVDGPCIGTAVRHGRRIGNVVFVWYKPQDEEIVHGTMSRPDTENVIVPFALNGHRIPAQGIALGTASEKIGVF